MTSQDDHKPKRETVLVVDDIPDNISILGELLVHHYQVRTANSGQRALSCATSYPRPDIILLDIMMPDMDGYDVIRQLKANPETRDIPVIFVTALDEVESEAHGFELGAADYITKPISPPIVLARVACQLQLRAQREQLKQLNNVLEEKVEQRTAQLKSTISQLDTAHKNLAKQYTDTVIAFAKIIEMRPGIKSGQSKYIAEKSVMVARELGVDTEEKKNILYAGMLMQIGKMGLPEALLNESFHTLSDIDRYKFHRHAIHGETLLAGLAQLKTAATLIRHQYEHYDGTGFPDGLSKKNIPLGSRIIAVVRDYMGFLEGSITGEPLDVNEAIHLLVVRRGIRYDPEVVDVFVNLLKADSDDTEQTAVDKSWRTGSVVPESPQNHTIARPVIEILWTELRPGMEIASVHFDNSPYFKNCIATQKTIQSLAKLISNSGKHPVVKIRLGAK